MKNRSLHLLSFLTSIACASFAGAQSDGPLRTQLAFVGSDPFYGHTQYSNGPSLSDSHSGVWYAGSITSAFGALHTFYQGHGNGNTQPKGSVQGGVSGWWRDNFAISNPALNGTTAYLRTTYRVSGMLTANLDTTNGSRWMTYSVAFDGGDASVKAGYDTSGMNVPLSTYPSVVIDRGFIFGGAPLQTQVSASLGGNFDCGAYGGVASGLGDITVSVESYKVIDPNGNPLDYTLGSSGGNSRGSNLAGGASYTSFSLTNDTANGHVGSTLALLGGTASANTNVSAAFTAAPFDGTVQPVSDAVALSGTGSDPVVIQLDYPSAAAASNLRLGWFNPDTGKWTNAVSGNSGGQPQFFNRAYNPATDFHVGYFGVDATNHVVWAVVNHNSIFAAAAVPDPLTLLSAVSRKLHNGAPYDVALPLSGNVGVECRRSSLNNDHQVILTFSGPVTSVGSMNLSATKGGSVSNTSVNGATVTVDLTGIANEQIINLDVLQATNGTETTSGAVSMGVLLGDANGDGTVNSGDATFVRNRSGQDTSATNFRADVNADGGVNSADATAVRARSGTTIVDPFGQTGGTQKLRHE